MTGCPKLSYWARIYYFACSFLSPLAFWWDHVAQIGREPITCICYISNLLQRHNLHMLILFLVQGIARFPMSCEVSSFGIIFNLRDWNVNKGAFADYPNNCRAWKTQNNLTIILAAAGSTKHRGWSDKQESSIPNSNNLIPLITKYDDEIAAITHTWTEQCMENGLGHKGGVVVEEREECQRVPKSSIDRASPISLSFITSCQDLSCTLMSIKYQRWI